MTHPEVMIERPYVEPVPVTRGPWVYEQSDPALMLFTAAMSRFNLTFPPHARILELGCAESDWLERMHRWDPSFELVGVDTRRQERQADGFQLIQGSALDPNLFEPESFDRVVLLGALEHFGLGFYGDPEHYEGDRETMRNVARWLRPSGLVYFDVPCQPRYSVTENRHFRMYAAKRLTTGIEPDAGGTIEGRLIWPAQLVEVTRAYSLPEPHAGTWCHEPTEDRVPYWFCCVVAEKPEKP